MVEAAVSGIVSVGSAIYESGVDGIEESLTYAYSMELMCARCYIPNTWALVFEFDSSHPGYGNRVGQVLSPVKTHHKAEIIVEFLVVKSAVLGDKWDMLKQEMVNLGET